MTLSPRLLIALLLVPLQVVGQQALEIIPLRHRTVEQVVPALRPLLEPGATMTGQRGQLVVRTSPANLAELRQALAAIDQPARRLLVSVRFDHAETMDRNEVSASGRIGSRSSELEVRARQERPRLAERVDQRLQVLEGGRALIMSGQVAPVPGGVWQGASGFEIVPRLAGERVLVDIAPQKESFERQQRMVTSVSAALGEWFEVGRTASRAATPGARASASLTLWLKVEALP